MEIIEILIAIILMWLVYRLYKIDRDNIRLNELYQKRFGEQERVEKPIKEGHNKKGTGTYDSDSTRMEAFLKGYEAGVAYAVDKAVKWLYEHREEVQTEDNGISGWIPDKLIMDFKQALET